MMLKNKIQKGSNIQVITGKYKNQIAQVLKVRNLLKTSKVKVDNLNLKTRYYTNPKTKKRTIYKAESWLDISNLKLVQNDEQKAS